jgi:hypothetical protein
MVHWWVLVHSGPYILPLPTSSRFEKREPPDSRKYQCWAVLSRNAGSLSVFRPDIGLYHQWFPFHETLPPRTDPQKIVQELVFVSNDGWFFYLAPVIFRFLDRLYNITSSSCMINPCPQNQTGTCQIRINHPPNQTGVCQNGKTCPYSRPGTKNQPRFFMNVNQVLWNLKTEFL